MKAVARVLVIKLSALGDFVLAFPAFERIRTAHRDARITLLTTPPFEGLARTSPFFDRVETDGRPRGLAAWLAVVTRLRRDRYDRVYDLQTNERTNLYFQMLRPFAPAWSGIAFGCALPHRNPNRMAMHTLERQAEQLKAAGIWPDAPTKPMSAPPPDLSWVLARALAPPAVAVQSAQPLALLVPGSSPHRPEKRWPVERYAGLAKLLEAAGFEVAIIGGPQEGGLARAIQAGAGRARDLTGQTDFAQIAALGARAAVAIGNDTGPVHLIAAAGAPTIVLFSSASDPTLCGPRGNVTVLRAPDLDQLPADTVLTAALDLAAPRGR
jgi:ADP-heptose:LPS heptosyltransferase